MRVRTHFFGPAKAGHYTAHKAGRYVMIAVLAAAAALVAVHAAPSRVHVTIMSTTDLHGNILPLDYYTNTPDQRGLAKVSTLVKQARKENPNLLLVDSGDTIQGSPIEYLHNRKTNEPPDPMMMAMNALHYDSMTVGNHEYNFGLQVLEKARREATFPWLSANTYNKGTDETHYQPYLVKTVGGVRVGVLGLTTPDVPSWDNPPNWAGLEFHEPLAEAKKWVAVLRGKERVDLVVVAMHMGLEADLATGVPTPGQLPNENQGIAIAEQVPGIDVILLGHTHRDTPAVVINGVLITQADRWGHRVARVDAYMEQSGADGRWRVAAKAARTIEITAAIEPDPEIVKMVEPYDREAQAWLSRPIGESSADLAGTGSTFRDNAVLDLVQRVQLDVGHADVSMVASFNDRARIPKGPVTVREVAGIYIYDNTLVVLDVTGKQVKDALEYSAKYFKPYVPGTPAAELIDRRIPQYNFDIAEGVTYDIDITKPLGQRILNLGFKGRPLQATEHLRLATNNYRVNGGGGYAMYKDAPVVQRSSQEIRDLIIDWVETHHQIPPDPTNNWHLLPAGLR